MSDLKLQHLEKVYDNKVKAVYDFNLDVHDGELMVALAKKTVKDRCLSCGAPLTGVTDENSRCSYCGNLIMGVLEKK